MIIIGMGTGRCGTRSLSKLLDLHPQITCGHEQQYQLWDVDISKASRVLSKMPDMSGDVGFYWINYVGYIRDNFDAKFVCLKRDKSAVIDSYMRNQVNPMYSNFLMDIAKQEGQIQRLCDRVTEQELEQMDYYTREWVTAYWDEPMINERLMEEYFPKYGIVDQRDYVSQYYDDYYAKAYSHMGPDFLLLDMNYVLNTKEGRTQLFNFIGVSPVFDDVHVKNVSAITIGEANGRI